MPPPTKLVWKAKSPEPEPAKQEAAASNISSWDEGSLGQQFGEKGKGKGKKAAPQSEAVAPSAAKISRGKQRERKKADEPYEDDAAEQWMDLGKGGKRSEEKSGKAKSKGKEARPAAEGKQGRKESSKGSKGSKGGKGKGKGGDGGKDGKGRSGGGPASARTVTEIESEMAKRREYGPDKQPLEADANFCDVKKHSGMGCAVISMRSPQARDAVLMFVEAEMKRKGQKASDDQLVVEIAGVDVQVRRHTDKQKGCEVKTDVFAAWGHQVERRNPLEAQSIADTFDELHIAAEGAMKARLDAAVPPGTKGTAVIPGQPLATAPPIQQVFPHQQAPPPPPAHVPQVGQIMAQSAAYAAHPPSPQHAQQPLSPLSPQHAQPPSPQHASFPDQYYWAQQQQQQLQQQQQQQYAAQVYAQQQQQLYEAQQQAVWTQQQQALQMQQAHAQLATEMAKPLPKPLQIKDPKDGSVINASMDFKPREPAKPFKIIDPKSGTAVE